MMLFIYLNIRPAFTGRTAAYRGDHDIVRILLAAGADVNRRDQMGVTALHWAASVGSLDTVIVLLQEGHALPNITEYSPSRNTPLDYASSAEQHEVVAVLSRFGGLSCSEVTDPPDFSTPR